MQSQAEPAQAVVTPMSNSTSRTAATLAANKLDPIAVLREELAAAALCHGVERVEDLAEDLVRRYVQRLGGIQVYFPTERFINRNRIAIAVKEEFDGRNVMQLAKKYSRSTRWIRNVINT